MSARTNLKRSVVIFVLLLAVTGIGRADWPMFQANARHTGRVSIFLDPRSFLTRWERTFESRWGLNAVAASDEKVFASLGLRFTNETGLFALDASTGNTLWGKNFGFIDAVNPPSYAYGNVYIQTGKSTTMGSRPHLNAYNAQTGDLVFRSAFLAQWEKYYAPTIYDGVVYINGGYYGGMYAFDAHSGSQIWFKDLNQYDEWTPAVDDQYAYAYVGRQYGRLAALHAVDRHSGSLAFKINDPNFDWHGWSMALSPVIGDQNDVLVIQDGRLLSFDLQEQSIRWELAHNFTGQPSVADGVIYAIDGGILTARKEATGNLIWSWQAPGADLRGQIIVTNMHLLVSTNSTAYAINLLTNKNVWSYPAGGQLALSDENLYIGRAHKLIAIAIGTSEPPIEASLKFTPQAVNPGSQGKWFKLHFVLPEGFEAQDVDVDKPALCRMMDTGDVIESNDMNVFVNKEDLVEIEAFFDRGALSLCRNGQAERNVTILGLLAGTGGQCFYGTDTIKIINKTWEHLAGLTLHWLEEGCGEPDWCDGQDLNQDGAVDFVDLALFDGCCIEIVAE